MPPLPRTLAPPLVFCLLFLSLALGGCKQEEKRSQPGRASMASDPVATLTLPTLDGKTYTFDPKDGQVSLVVFWATWCHPCLQEIPDLMALHARFADRGFRVVSINIDDPEGKKMAAIDARYNINYPLLIDDGTTEEKFGGLQALPTSFLIGRDGAVKRVIEGLFPPRVVEEAVLREL